MAGFFKDTEHVNRSTKIAHKIQGVLEEKLKGRHLLSEHGLPAGVLRSLLQEAYR